MDLDVKDEQGVTIISGIGELDASSSAQLNQTLDALVAEGYLRFVLDLKDINFIDSAGLAALVRAFKHTRGAAGDLRLAGLKPAVRRVFALTRLDRVFELHTDTAEAVRHLTRGA